MHVRRSSRRRLSLVLTLSAASSLTYISATAPARAQTTEKQKYGPALDARLLKTPTQPFVVYSRAPFASITATSAPAPGEIAAPVKLLAQACADELEPLTFSVYAARALKNATVTVSGDLISESKQSRIPASALEIHVVKPSGTTEYLVKDDRTDLASTPLSGAPKTDIAAGTSKQFWITVRVPRNQPASKLSGKLVFSATGVKPVAIPITVDVLPMRLRTAFLQHGIELKSRLTTEDSTTSPITEPDAFAAQLTDIREHGFKFVSLADPLPGLPNAFKALRDAKFGQSGPLVLFAPVKSKDDIDKIQQLRAEAGLGQDVEFYYGRASAPDATQIEAVGKELADLKKAGKNVQVLMPVGNPATLASLNSVLDIPVYPVDSEYPRKVLADGRRDPTNTKHDWWSWSAVDATPQQNRLNIGYLLYTTGLNGAGLYGAFTGPYPGAGDGRWLAYPVPGGVINTLQWEALREGVDDIRYLTNLKTYLREVKDLKIRKETTDEAEAYLRKALTAKPLAEMTPADFLALRQGVVVRSLKLLTILRGNASKYPD